MPVLSADDPQALALAARRLADGGLVGLPTETVYGLGARADDAAAVAAIYRAKGRPADHPLIVHVTDAAAALPFVPEGGLPAVAQRLVEAFWPGPLTVIVPRRAGVAEAAAGGQASIGLRCPAHPAAQALLRAAAALGVPGVAAPSANRFGRVSPTQAAHVADELGPELLVLDGGDCPLGIESAIVDCSQEPPTLLRPGVLTVTEIEAAAGRPLRRLGGLAPVTGLATGGDTAPTGAAHGADDAPTPAADPPADPSGPDRAGPVGPAAASPATLASAAELARLPRAPGLLASHYAPRARLRLFDAAALQRALQQRRQAATALCAPETAAQPVAGQAAQGLAVYSRVAAEPAEGIDAAARWHWQPMPDDPRAAAHDLFAVLRALDAQGVAEIWVERPPADAAWDGVRDRLQRAAAPTPAQPAAAAAAGYPALDPR